MKNQNARGYTAAQQAAIAELLTIALATPKRIADVNISVAMHCNLIGIDIYAGGWRVGMKPMFSENVSINIDYPHPLPVVLGEVKAILVKLAASTEGGK